MSSLRLIPGDSTSNLGIPNFSNKLHSCLGEMTELPSSRRGTAFSSSALVRTLGSCSAFASMLLRACINNGSTFADTSLLLTKQSCSHWRQQSASQVLLVCAKIMSRMGCVRFGWLLYRRKKLSADFGRETVTLGGTRCTAFSERGELGRSNC